VGELGDEVWGLSALGRKQATKTGRRLAALLGDEAARLEGLYASPWPRALQTAEIAARELGLQRVKVKPYLHESVVIVDAELAKRSTLPLTSPELRELASSQLAKVRGRFFRPARHTSTALVFCHGNLIRYLVAGTLGLALETWTALDSCHCSITEIRVYSPGHETLVRYNDTGHLPLAMITTT